MGGVKRRPGQRWSSVAALRKLWAPIFVKRIVLPCFFKNGKAYRDAPFEYRKGEILGPPLPPRGPFTPKHLRGIIAFGLVLRMRIYRSKYFRHCREEANSLLILMPSGDRWPHCLIDWKRRPAVFGGPEECFRSTRNSSVYSWISGIPEVALVVFVRKHAPEISIFESVHLGRAASGVRAPRGDNDRPD